MDILLVLPGPAPAAAVHSLAEDAEASDADLAITNLMSAFGLVKAQVFEQ